MTGAPERDEAVAVVRELLAGNIAALRNSAAEASTAVSMFQSWTKAAASIGDKLNAMARAAKKASSPDYTRVEVEEIQKTFESLAGEINHIAETFEYNYNKPFSAEGQSVSLRIGDGSAIDVLPRDLSFDAAGLDLAADAEAALSKVETAMEEAGEYIRHLRQQEARVAEATAAMDSELAAAAGVDLRDFSIELARRVADHAAEQFSIKGAAVLEVHADVGAQRILQLLEDRG
jgi:flagellin-like hook-associated protein FlgL